MNLNISFDPAPERLQNQNEEFDLKKPELIDWKIEGPIKKDNLAKI